VRRGERLQQNNIREASDMGVLSLPSQGNAKSVRDVGAWRSTVAQNGERGEQRNNAIGPVPPASG